MGNFLESGYPARLAGPNDLVRIGQHHAPALAVDPQKVFVPGEVGEVF